MKKVLNILLPLLAIVGTVSCYIQDNGAFYAKNSVNLDYLHKYAMIHRAKGERVKLRVE